MDKCLVVFTVAFKVKGAPNIDCLRNSINFGIYSAQDEGFLTPDDGSSEVINHHVYHVFTEKEQR